MPPSLTQRPLRRNRRPPKLPRLREIRRNFAAAINLAVRATGFMVLGVIGHDIVIMVGTGKCWIAY